MRRTIAAFLAAGTVVLAGCGSSSHFADRNRPPTPVNISVYVNDARVSVSPSSIGGGPLVFLVTNSASRTESVTIQPAGDSGSPIASTGPINPGTSAQVQVDLTQGDYTVTSSPSGQSEAASATSRAIKPATMHVGAQRPNANNAVLQP